MKAEGINIVCLDDDKDVGRWVRYCPTSGPRETGRIKWWNDKWIFVVYHCEEKWGEYQGYTGCATDPKDLEFIRE